MASLFDSFASIQSAVAHAVRIVSEIKTVLPATMHQSFDIVSTVFPLAKAADGSLRNVFDVGIPPPAFVIAANRQMYGGHVLDDKALPVGPYHFFLTLPLLNKDGSGPHAFFGLDQAKAGVLSIEETPKVSPDLSFTVPEVKGSVADVQANNGGTTLKGRGVIVGIIDYGFDFAHPNFINPEGTTRLLALWDQNAGTGANNQFQTVLDDLKPTGGWLNTTDSYATTYIYSPTGQFQSSAGKYSPNAAEKSINEQIKSATPYANYYDPHAKYFTLETDPAETAQNHGAHGTHVADIAAGNGAATGRPGIAPEADIIFVQLRQPSLIGGSPDTRFVLDAVHFIASYAQKNNKQAVINLSVNSNSGRHDASDTTVMALDAYAAGTASTGVSQRAPIVLSAGNQFLLAREPMKLTLDPAPKTPLNKKYRETMAQRIDMPAGGSDTCYWLFRRKPWAKFTTQMAKLEIWYRTSGSNTDTVTVEVTSRSDTGNKLVTKVIQSPPADQTGDTVPIKDGNNTKTVGQIYTRGALGGANAPRKITIEINPSLLSWQDNKNVVGTLAIKLTTSALLPQRAHVFIERAGITDPLQTSLVQTTVNAGDDVADDDLGTRLARACSLGTLSCGTSLIAIGAYFAPDRSGANAQIAEFSSSGPPVNYSSLDEALPETGAAEQPWISAPGTIVLAARSKGGRLETPPVDMAVVMSGTSMAAPHVTGTIALMLQKTANATTANIRKALRDAARRDISGSAYEETVWHKRFGHGKLNVAGAVSRI